MTPEQRYMLDTIGYIHIKSPLNPEELRRAQEAADRYINTPIVDLPVGFFVMTNAHHTRYARGFAFDRALEHLTMHPSIWPIIKELTGNKPCLCRGGMLVNTHEHDALELHVGEGRTVALGVNHDGANSPGGLGEPGTIYCHFFNIFWYLHDVRPGDGGPILAPGSHKSEFEFPLERLHQSADTLAQGIVNITPNAGDAIVVPELLMHGALKWKPVDRDRRVMLFRYKPQCWRQLHTDDDQNLEEEIEENLATETLELLAYAWHSHEKEIAGRDNIRLI